MNEQWSLFYETKLQYIIFNCHSSNCERPLWHPILFVYVLEINIHLYDFQYQLWKDLLPLAKLSSSDSIFRFTLTSIHDADCQYEYVCCNFCIFFGIDDVHLVLVDNVARHSAAIVRLSKRFRLTTAICLNSSSITLNIYYLCVDVYNIYIYLNVSKYFAQQKRNGTLCGGFHPCHLGIDNILWHFLNEMTIPMDMNSMHVNTTCGWKIYFYRKHIQR